LQQFNPSDFCSAQFRWRACKSWGSSRGESHDDFDQLLASSKATLVGIAMVRAHHTFEFPGFARSLSSTASWREDVSKFEVVAGRIERDGSMSRRFACATPRRTLSRLLIAAALDQSAWGNSTVLS